MPFPNNFSEMYCPGEVLSLSDINGETVTTALVLDYDPVTSIHRRQGEPEERNHWHVAVLEPDTEVWLPAAIWQGISERGGLGSHISRFHRMTQEFNEQLDLPEDPFYLAFRVEELQARVGAILDSTVGIEVRPLDS